MRTKIYLVLVMIVFIFLPGCSDRGIGDSMITYSGTKMTVEGKGIKAEGSRAVITEPGFYTVTGCGKECSILIDTGKDDVTILLDNADLTGAEESVIDYKGTGTLTVECPEGSTCSIVSDSVCVGSSGDLRIKGSGALELVSEGGSAVSVKGDMTADGIRIRIESSDDGIRSDGTLSIKDSNVEIRSDCDGISSSGRVTLERSDVSITAGKGHEKSKGEVSQKGIKCGKEVVMLSGNLTVDSSDDCINSSGNTVMEDGVMTLYTSDDAVHSDEAVIVNGGKILIGTCHEGLEAEVISLQGGTVHIVSDEDSVNASGGGKGSLVIDGADLILISGGDGLDTNGDIKILSGTVMIVSDSDADTAFDYRKSFVIEGGEVFAVWRGSETMLPECKRPFIYLPEMKEAGEGEGLMLSSGTDNIAVYVPFDGPSVYYTGPLIRDESCEILRFRPETDLLNERFGRNVLTQDPVSSEEIFITYDN